MAKTTTTRYTHASGSTLAIRLKTGSKGYNVSATMRVPGERTQTGCRSTHESEPPARAAFDKLKADALAKGWAEQTRKDTRSSFIEIPAPSAPKTPDAARKGRAA